MKHPISHNHPPCVSSFSKVKTTVAIGHDLPGKEFFVARMKPELVKHGTPMANQV